MRLTVDIFFDDSWRVGFHQGTSRLDTRLVAHVSVSLAEHAGLGWRELQHKLQQCDQPLAVGVQQANLRLRLNPLGSTC